MLQPDVFIRGVCGSVPCYSFRSMRRASLHLLQGPDQCVPAGGACFWPALRKHVKPQCRWFRLTHFIWKSSGEGEEETGNYSGGDNMGQPVKLPGLLPLCVAVPRCLPRSWPYTNTPPLLTPPSSIFGTLWADPRQLFPAAQPVVLEMSNSRSMSKKLITAVVQK